MRNIVLLVHDDAGQEARVRCALDVARAVGGQLQCVDVALLPILADCVQDGYGEAILVEQEHQREQANKKRLEDRLGRQSVPWTWLDAAGSFASCIETASALADLIVLNRKLDSFPYPDMRKTTTEILLDTGKPILAVPDTALGMRIDGRALVAWDGSAKAGAALQAAVPLLKRASDVVLVEIDDGWLQTPASEALEYLVRHDIEARLVRDFALSESVGKILLVAIEIQRPDYVVMGAYSHWRTTETVLGGVTRRMLSESPVPIFLAH